MELGHEFTVPVGVDEAWRTLLDLERVAPCFPGATLTSHDEAGFAGTVKVKLGPVTLLYKGTGQFVERDDAAHRMVLDASGKDTRGAGTAKAKVTATLQPSGEQTTVAVQTDLKVTGRPAQLSRGLISEVGGRLVDQFAECLARKLAAPEAAAGEPSGDGQVGTESAPTDGAAESVAAQAKPSGGPRLVEVQPEAEPIDLLGTAGVPVLKRALPVIGGLVLLAILFAVLRRRRHPAAD